ncbi:Bax inhibitor 1-related protein [Cynara cardunculus var. scolymus]|uniref:Bax inhibitor 1-related protein n=1 Tax=Cynara cardunculus var. scolymus TaxID=59895 RepID=A0A118JTX9_CYNCS|nr:Bax inhibitor 1-related protein [Cynara cardunculus var. scolymus]
MFEFTRVSTKEDREGDIEEGVLYPGISHGENQLRWGFIRKVYGILAAQMVLTTAVSFLTVLYAPINELLRGNSGLLLFFVFLPFILLWPLHVYQQKHPLNFVFLGLFTASLSLTVGVSCANTDGKIVLEALILTSAVMFFPVGPTSNAIIGGLGAVLFSGYIIYDTENLIKRFTYDEYIWASVTLYLDILNLFLAILRMLRQGDN